MSKWRSVLACVLVLSVVACSSTPPQTPPLTNQPSQTASTTPGATSSASTIVSPGATGTVQPTDSGSPGPTQSLAPPPSGPTSPELILTAIEDGRLDAPTALLYRIYALFGDSRLPAEYVTETWAEDDVAIAQAFDELDSLPADIASEMRPFLARPTDPESVLHEVGPSAFARRHMASRSAAIYGASLAQLTNPYTSADFVCEASGWGHIDGGILFGGPAWKVWSPCNDASGISQAVAVAGTMLSLYDAETRLMGPHIPDGGGPAEAGDGALDVYLVNQCVSRGGRCMGQAFAPGTSGTIANAYVATAAPCLGNTAGAEKCSGYIVVRRSAIGPDMPGTLAHELFHVLQFAHNRRGIAIGGRWNWFAEASAKWAQFYFYAPGRPGGVYPFVLAYEATPLSLTRTNGQNEYASFTWPLFMQLNGGDAKIAAAWRAIEDQVGEQAVNAAIDGVLPFAANFREFSVTAWNDVLAPPPDPVSPHFWDADGSMPRIEPFAGRFTLRYDLPPNPRSAPPKDVPENIPSLAARYSRLSVDPDVRQIILDFSGLSPPQDLDVDALLRIKDKGWERRKLPLGETRFCLNDPPDNVQDMILVLSNHNPDSSHVVKGSWTVKSIEDPCQGYDISIEWTDVYDGVPDTIIFEGVVDTIDPNSPVPEGMVYMTGTGTASGSRLGWKLCNPGIDVTPSGTVPATFQAIIDGDKITVSAFADVFTALSGVSTAPFEADIEGETVVLGRTPPVGELCPHSSYGTATITPYEVRAP